MSELGTWNLVVCLSAAFHVNNLADCCLLSSPIFCLAFRTCTPSGQVHLHIRRPATILQIKQDAVVDCPILGKYRVQNSFTEPTAIVIYTGFLVGRDSSVGITTRYGLDGPGIECHWDEIFHTRPDRPWSPPSLLYHRYWVSLPGVKRPERGVDHPPHLAPRLKKE
jgi:hypothetical protein